jgi:hypothetical protein
MEWVVGPSESGAELLRVASGSLGSLLSRAGISQVGAGSAGEGSYIQHCSALVAALTEEPGSCAAEVHLGSDDLERVSVNRQGVSSGPELSDIQHWIVIGRQSSRSRSPMAASGVTHNCL